MKASIRARLNRLAPREPRRFIVVSGESRSELDEKIKAAEITAGAHGVIVAICKLIFSDGEDEQAFAARWP